MLLDARQKLFIFAVPTRSAETVHVVLRDLT